MEYKVFVFVEEDTNFDEFSLLQLQTVLAQQNCTLSCFCAYKSYQNVAQVLSQEGNLILFFPNDKIDEIITQNINALSNDKNIIDEQAVVFNKEGGKVVFLPIDSDWDNQLAKVNLNQSKANKMFAIKLFGLSKERVDSTLQSLKSQIQDFQFTVVQTGGLKVEVYISYTGSDDLIDNSQVKIATAFKNNMYSENSLDLCQTLFQLAKLKNVHLSICEGITGGALLKQLCCCNLNPQDVVKQGKVEFMQAELLPDNVYKQTLTLLEKADSNLLGINVQGEYKDGQLVCIYAIGNNKSIDVYRNIFKIKQSDAVDFAVNVIMFNIIKKLRQNNLAF